MSDAELRARVTRLIDGREFRIDDLRALFLALRERSGGRETVREMGDFIAHRNERNRGATTKRARHFFRVARLGMIFQGRAIDYADLPSDFGEILKINLQSIPVSELKDRTGMTHSSAKGVLEVITSSIRQTPSGRTYLLFTPSVRGRLLINCLAGYLMAKPAFDDTRLVNEFVASLKENKLLDQHRVREFRKNLSDVIGLFAIVTMHQAKIDLTDGPSATLYASPNTGHGFMGVFAMATTLPSESLI